jgi:hypothetical protein
MLSIGHRAPLWEVACLRITRSLPWTLAAGATTGFWVSWENIEGTGPNHGPLVIMADPVSHQKAEIKLTTFDPTKCRRAPGPSGSTEVFYEFKIRNGSAITASYAVELVDFKDLM